MTNQNTNETTQGTTDAPAGPARVLRPCSCSFLSVRLPAGSSVASAAARRLVVSDDAAGVLLASGCTARSLRSWAPGHDARAVALLQTAARTPGAVVLVADRETDPARVLAAFPGLAAKVQAPAPVRTARVAGPAVVSDEPPAALASLLA